MTPAIAIKLECRWCMGSVKSFTCDSQICKLNDKSLTPLKRIKFHCLDCVESREEVKNCSGKLMFEDRLCYLHPYRLGKNANLKGRKGGNLNIKFIAKTLKENSVLAV